MSHRCILAMCVLAGLALGCEPAADDGALDVARILGLLPFFVLGLKSTPERLELLRSRAAQVAALAATLGGGGPGGFRTTVTWGP